MCSYKPVKGLVSENPWAVKSAEISRKELLSYFFLIRSQIELEKVTLVRSKNIKDFLWTFYCTFETYIKF